ncbi:transmembrane protein 267 [Anopheles marshallii]|uniref:transmembrane protein 267 n=1 Tax=Anopheles marshallii TaxID=1521116 RepID=UPI00237AB897|nr:transmembrane protein 267 [Anopheles marshallii]
MNFNALLFLKHVTLCCVCVFGDKLTEYVQNPALSRACIDNATHAFIGCVAAEIVLHSFKYQLARQEYCLLLFTGMIVSSFIDLDHFIEARSFSLQEATHLRRRPFLHNSAICVIILMLLILTKRVGSIKCGLFIAMAFIAFSTHHLRDATRRGIWIKLPFQDSSSPAIPYVAYLVLVNIIPHVIHHLLQTTLSNSSSVPKMKLVEMV